MNEQPIALWLADQLRKGDPWVKDEAANELCRLHALNGELLEALKLITDVGDRAATEIARDAIAKAQGENT